MTIKDIAKLSGYAVGTVSRVLNGHPDVSEEAREKVLAVVEAHQFRPNNNARHLKRQASSGVALIVKGTQNMLFADLVERIQARVKDGGYSCLVYYIDEDDNEVQQALQVCRERRPMGILFLGSNLSLFQTDFAQIKIPCVLVTNSAAGLALSNLSSVSTDDTAAARQAVEKLMDLGHRTIGILGGRTEQSNAAQFRLEGVRQAFAARGMRLDEERQYETARFTLPGGYAAMERLLDRLPDMTAVFAMSDVQARPGPGGPPGPPRPGAAGAGGHLGGGLRRHRVGAVCRAPVDHRPPGRPAAGGAECGSVGPSDSGRGGARP